MLVRGYDNTNKMVWEVYPGSMDSVVMACKVEMDCFGNPFGIVRIDVYDCEGFVVRWNRP